MWPHKKYILRSLRILKLSILAIYRQEGELLKREQANELWTELFARTGNQWLPVLTGSMSPLIRPRDSVLVTHASENQLCIGDIIVFHRGENLIVHRVINKRQNVLGTIFQERGDHSPFYRQVSGRDVVGKVIAVKRGEKILGLSSTYFRLTSYILGCLSYGYTVVINSFRFSKRKNLRRTDRYLSILLLALFNFLARAFILDLPTIVIPLVKSQPHLK